MARFDVYRTATGALLLDCQSDFLTSVETRLVAPLRPGDQVKRSMARLMPIFEVDGTAYVMVTPLLVGIPIKDVGRRVASLAHEQDAIINAIDMLLSGY